MASAKAKIRHVFGDTFSCRAAPPDILVKLSGTRGKNVDQSARLFTFCALRQSDCVKFAKRKQKERGNSILL